MESVVEVSTPFSVIAVTMLDLKVSYSVCKLSNLFCNSSNLLVNSPLSPAFGVEPVSYPVNCSCN